ncbi:hypothetical protein K0M31_019634 [Melipona bicolor]|uniref:Uncharacterized protein n=1 Tax=Melipona bicolor TaxID=60889 RepID=A0AA40G2S9_9HYME|nr:hypothetical protein K0M31_019634 [Melipona bicolor]
MRKAKDDRVKITTHHFRISIEEETDEENEEVESPAAKPDRRISITIETDSDIVIAPQDAELQSLSSSSGEQEAAAASSQRLQRDWIEQEKKVQSFESKTSRNSDDSQSDSRSVKEVDSKGPTDQKKKKKKKKKSNDENLFDDSKKRESSESKISKESHGIFATGSSSVLPPSTSLDRNFGGLCSKIGYSVDKNSYESANSTKKLEHGANSFATPSLPFEASNRSESTPKCHVEESLSSYETSCDLQSNPDVQLQNLGSNERTQQSVVAAEIEETKILDPSTVVPPGGVYTSSLLIRRRCKLVSAFLKRSSSLEDVSTKKNVNDSPRTRQDSVRTNNNNNRNNTSLPKDSEEETQIKEQRRSTLPMVNVDSNSTDALKISSYQNVLSGTSVNPIRRSSITSVAICSSLAPSLLSAYPGIPNCLMPASNGAEKGAEKGAESSNNSLTTINEQMSERSGAIGLKLKLPFLRLHLPAQQPASDWREEDKEEDPSRHSHHHHHRHHHHHHHVLPHFHVPTFTFTASSTSDGEPGRRFNFGIHRHSLMVSRLWVDFLSFFLSFFSWVFVFVTGAEEEAFIK